MAESPRRTTRMQGDGRNPTGRRPYDPMPGDSPDGCGWPVALEFELPPDWPSGGYRGRECVEEHHLIVVRHGAREAPLLLCATPTWVAYNCRGGSDAYEGIAGPDGRRNDGKRTRVHALPAAVLRPGDIVTAMLPVWRLAMNAAWAAARSRRGQVAASTGSISPRSM